MYATHDKREHKFSDVIERHPLVARAEHFIASNRFWALMAMVLVAALALAAVVMLIMLVVWIASMDVSMFDIRT